MMKYTMKEATDFLVEYFLESKVMIMHKNDNNTKTQQYIHDSLSVFELNPIKDPPIIETRIPKAAFHISLAS